MARYGYIGPEEERGDVPTFDFDEGVVEPAVLRRHLDAGHLVRSDAPAAPEPSAEPEPAEELPEGTTKTTETPAARPIRRASARPATRPTAPKRGR